MSELNDLIQYHKDCLAQYRHLISPATVYLEEQTIKCLEELKRLRIEANEGG